MKIIHISTYDKVGGAAIAAFRLHSAMLQKGFDSQMFVLHSFDSFSPKVFKIEKPKQRLWGRLFPFHESHRLKNYHPNYLFSTGTRGVDISNHHLIRSADAIYIHWINDLLSVSNIQKLLDLNKPVFWFMHDMWPLTGGCHHSFDCSRYTELCGRCSCLNSGQETDVSSEIHQLKIESFSRYSNLYAITPSKWLEKCCKESILFKNREVYVVPNLIDTTVFKPIDKKVAREMFNFPLNKKLILFGANAGVDNIYKGWKYLKEALLCLSLNDYEMVVFGSSYNSSIEEALPCKIHFMGHLYDTTTLAMLYNAVNVYVTPSLAESFGQTIVEAMACSTPVTAFDVGAIPELIEHQKTGYLAKCKDYQDLAIGIQWCLASWCDATNGVAARSFVERYCSFQSGINLHEKILAHYLTGEAKEY